MSDLTDNAQATDQLFLDIALSHRKPELPAIGKCHWCEEPAQPGAHFCDVDCRSDYEQHQVFKG